LLTDYLHSFLTKIEEFKMETPLGLLNFPFTMLSYSSLHNRCAYS
jgi:hypothetical protein